MGATDLADFPQEQLSKIAKQRRSQRASLKLAEILEGLNLQHLLLTVIQSKCAKLSVHDPRQLEHFAKESPSESDTARFLGRLCPEFRQIRRSLVSLLVSFEFTLDIEDLNAHFTGLRHADYTGWLAETLESLPHKATAKLASKIFRKARRNEPFHPLNYLREKQPQSESQTLASALEALVLRLLVLGYKRVQAGLSLRPLCEFLNARPEVAFCGGFWSESLIVQLLFHYARFDLCLRLRDLLVQKGPVPLMLGDLFALCSASSHLPLSNPFVGLFAEKQLGVLSWPVGSARLGRLGKSELLNHILHTQFDTNSDDALADVRVEVDLARNWDPARSVAVIDCNWTDQQFLDCVRQLANVVIVSVDFGDLISDFANTEREVQAVLDRCKQPETTVLVVVRDWAEFKAYADSDVSEHSRRKVFAAKSPQSDSHQSTHSDSDGDFSSVDILDELHQYQNFLRKKSKKPNRGKRVKQAQQRLESSPTFRQVTVCKLVNQVNGKNPKKQLQRVACQVNEAINSIDQSQFRFNSENFNEFIRDFHCKTRDRLELRWCRQLNHLCTQDLAELDYLMQSVEFDPDRLFPLHPLWREQSECRAALAALNAKQLDQRIHLEAQLRELDARISKAKLTHGLREFWRIVCDSTCVFSLVRLFEQRLAEDSEDGFTRDRMQSRATGRPRVGDMSLFWQNTLPFLDPARDDLSVNEKESILSRLETLVEKGYSFQVISGDSHEFRASLLGMFRNRLRPQDRLATLSIFGPQSSGKSTLVNSMFGATFKTGVGRCTAGVLGSLVGLHSDFGHFQQCVKTKQRDLQMSSVKISGARESASERRDREFLLILDSQGMFSEEARETQLDQKLGTFLLTVSQVVLVTFDGEFSRVLKGLLQVCHHAYINLDTKRLIDPGRGSDWAEEESGTCPSCLI